MDPIDSYLDELAARLRIGRADARRLLSEAEEHLREAADVEVVRGSATELAQRRAVERFGTAREVAAAANGSLLTRLGPMTVGAARLAAVASLTVLAGTVLARLMAAVSSTPAVYGLPHGYLPSQARVAHWLAVQPSSAGWSGAAAAENADDTLLLRGGFALVCLVASLVLLRVARRRVSPPAERVVPVVGLIAFSGTAVLLLLGGLTNAYTQMEWGRGLWFSDAGVAALAAAMYALNLRRRVRAV
ncbi:MAG: hypothetical protein QOK15_3440 [Nocardioidaceae bacterium]|nr:hypothetical protein [Nocardioidaceae bacterium]